MAAVAQPPSAMSADELARSLRAHLERRGVMRGLTARLRRDLTLEVRGQRPVEKPSSRANRLRDSVIAEALRTHHAGHAYAVFVPESSLGEERACLDASELQDVIGSYPSTALDSLLTHATRAKKDGETQTTTYMAGESLGDRLELVRRKFRAQSREKENIANEATLNAEAEAAALKSADGIIQAQRDADADASSKRLHARYRDELESLSRNVKHVLHRENESRADAVSAAADRARADDAKAEARRHQAQAEKLQTQFTSAVADANHARTEVLQLREALVLQREDAASRARVQLGSAEFAARERRKTEDERARASELADDLAGPSADLAPSRAGQLDEPSDAVKRAAAAFRLSGRSRAAVASSVVFEAPADPVRALDAALAAGDAAERGRAQACASLEAEVAANDELRSELRALRNLVDQSRGALDALAREPASTFSRVHVVAKPPPPPPSRSIVEAGPPRFQLVDTRELYSSRGRRRVPEEDDDELVELRRRKVDALAKAKTEAEAAEASAAAAALRRREAALVERERAIYAAPPAAAPPPPVHVAPPVAAPPPVAAATASPPASAEVYVSPPVAAPPAEPAAAVYVSPPVAAAPVAPPPVAPVAPPPVAAEPVAAPPPVAFQNLTAPVALDDAATLKAEARPVSPPQQPRSPMPKARSPRSPRRAVTRGGMLGADDASSDDNVVPETSPRTQARRKKARLAEDRREAEWVAAEAVKANEARRRDREENAERYAAEAAAQELAEAEATIGETDVLRIRKIYEECSDEHGLSIPNLLTALAKLTGTKPPYDEGVELAGGPGSIVASADALVRLLAARDPTAYTPPPQTDAAAIFQRVLEQRQARQQTSPARSASRSDTRSDTQSVSDVALDAADSPRASQASPRASDAGSDFWG